MKAIVRKVNYRRGMVVFEKEDGDYGYFEILDSVDLEEEDILRGDFAVHKLFLQRLRLSMVFQRK